jgi:hypothetical protein
MTGKPAFEIIKFKNLAYFIIYPIVSFANPYLDPERVKNQPILSGSVACYLSKELT